MDNYLENLAAVLDSPFWVLKFLSEDPDKSTSKKKYL